MFHKKLLSNEKLSNISQFYRTSIQMSSMDGYELWAFIQQVLHHTTPLDWGIPEITCLLTFGPKAIV
jgi:hypothetical protein